MSLPMSCKNCRLPVQHNYCSHCGQKIIRSRLTVNYLMNYLLATLTNLETGLWFTLRKLLKSPGTVIKEYIEGRTRPYYHPLRLDLLMATLSVLIVYSFADFQEMQDVFNKAITPEIDDETRAFQAKAQATIQPFMNLVPILLIPFMALASRWLFRKQALNLAEHMVLQAFIYGLVSFISIPLLFIYGWFDLFLLSPLVGFVLTCMGLFFTFREIFGQGFWLTSLKSVASYLLGYLLFFFVMGILGTIFGIVAGMAGFL